MTPQPTTTWPPPTPAPELNHKQLKALAKAARPWYRKKRVWALAVGLLVAISAAGGTEPTPEKLDDGPAGFSQLQNCVDDYGYAHCVNKYN